MLKMFLTINVPLFLEVRDFMFFREKHIISHFAGFFWGGRLFWRLNCPAGFGTQVGNIEMFCK
jgi:hypothetical protein